jgi:class 3 adenylate cyclase
MDDPSPKPAQAEMYRATLRFRDAELEARYRAARMQADLRQARVSILAGAVINVGFAPLDYLILTENLGATLILRIVAGLLLGLVMLALTYARYFESRLVYGAAFAISSFTLIYAALIAVSGAPDVYLSGYVLVILFVLFFVPVGFVNACVIAWSGTILFAVLVTLTRSTDLGSLLTVYSQFLAANFMGAFALYWMERFHRLDFVNLEAIATERSRYGDLLVRILPRSIVERLERGERSIADDFAEATVLFADIAGFTGVSAQRRPAEMVAFLNRIFGRFDELVARHEVEKIKTIGDAYMVAGGVPRVRPDHAEAIAELALDMMAETDRMEGPDGAPVRIRIGIHTGPLVAGVIGESRFAYDIWGDTVNTASRMENLSPPGRIHVSDALYQRLNDKYRFERHGEIEVKGKGPMTTWHLTSRLPASASATS